MHGSLAAAYATRPEISRSLAEHVRAVTQGGTVSRRTKELCALMVSWLNACIVCAKSHEALARHLGIEQATLDALEDYARSPLFTEAERAAIGASIALTREPRALPPAVRDALDAHYAPGEVSEIVAVIGLYNYLNRLNNALVEATPEIQGCEP